MFSYRHPTVNLDGSESGACEGSESYNLREKAAFASVVDTVRFFLLFLTSNRFTVPDAENFFAHFTCLSPGLKWPTICFAIPVWQTRKNNCR